MKNCNCNKKPEPVVPCSNPCDRRDHVIKLFVDECSGRPVDPVTVATAVFTEDCKSVQEMLDALADAKTNLENKLNELEDKTLNSENYQSLISKINRLLESINELNGIKSHLTDYINVIQQIGLLQDKVNSQTLKITNIESDLNSLRSQLANITHDYTALLTSINTILALNKLLFETMLDKLNTGGSGSDIDLRNYYTKTDIDGKITTINNSITSLTNRIRTIEDTYLKGFKDDNNTFVNNHEILPSVHGILRIDPQAKSGGNDNRSDYAFILKGDITGDGKVDVEDVNAAINIILKFKNQNNYPGDADLNGDNKVDVEDVNAIINIILKLVPLEYVIKNIKTGVTYAISKNLMYFNTRTNMLCYLQTEGNKVTGLQDVEYGGIDISKLCGYYYLEGTTKKFQVLNGYTEATLPEGAIAIDATFPSNMSTIEINGVAVQFTFPIVKRKDNNSWYRIATINGDEYTCDADAFIDGGQMTPANP